MSTHFCSDLVRILQVFVSRAKPTMESWSPNLLLNHLSSNLCQFEILKLSAFCKLKNYLQLYSNLLRAESCEKSQLFYHLCYFSYQVCHLHYFNLIHVLLSHNFRMVICIYHQSIDISRSNLALNLKQSFLSSFLLLKVFRSVFRYARRLEYSG